MPTKMLYLAYYFYILYPKKYVYYYKKCDICTDNIGMFTTDNVGMWSV